MTRLTRLTRSNQATLIEVKEPLFNLGEQVVDAPLGIGKRGAHWLLPGEGCSRFFPHDALNRVLTLHVAGQRAADFGKGRDVVPVR